MNGDDTQRLELYDEIVERVMEAEEDADYYRAIHSGKWPSGKEILERALKKYDSTES
jgi:hypothetical protein